MSPTISAASASLDRSVATPLYVQLERILRDHIASGAWRPGEQVPSENQLNQQFGVSRMTARAVLTTLVNEGLLYRAQGKGTFVSEGKIDTIPPAYRGVREQLEDSGRVTATRVLACVLEVPPARVRGALALRQRQQAYRLHRLRLVDGRPFSLHTAWVSRSLAPGLERHDAGANQLCEILEHHYGLTRQRVREQLESVALSPDDALHLGARPGAPALVLWDTIVDAGGAAFEFSRIVFPGDRVRLHFDYEV